MDNIAPPTIEASEVRRAAEHRAFENVTRQMADAETMGETEAARSALESNRMLWSILKDNIFADENQLTEDLKGQIFSLATWVEGYTTKVLDGEREIGALICINQTIMEGLAA